MNLQDIVKLIRNDNIKIVSFDMFDTLVMRPVIKPTDLFRLIGRGIDEFEFFEQMRVNAEKNAAANRSKDSEAITLDEIYSAFQSIFLTDENKTQGLKKRELDFEYKYLRQRKSAKYLYDVAKASGKKIVITSDMYLPKNFLEKVLAKNGYYGYEAFYLSCEEKVCKKTTRLYKKMILDYKSEGILAEQILHIGDSKESDVDAAKKSGIRAISFPKAIDVFKANINFKPLYDGIDPSLDNSFIVAYIAQELFDDPYVEYDLDSVFNGAWENIAKIVFGPLLLVFSKWLIEDSINEGIEKIYFLHRDGYIPKKVFDLLGQYYTNAPETAELYLNRSMMHCFSALKENGLIYARYKYPLDPKMSIEDFIQRRLFATDPENIAEILSIFLENGYKSKNDSIGYLVGCENLWGRLDPYFKKNASRRISGVKEYCESVIESDKKIALYDTGYRGRACKFLKDEFGIHSLEYHICAKPELHKVNLCGYKVKSLIHSGLDVERECGILYVLLDDILSIQEPGIDYIEKNNSIEIHHEQRYVYSNEIELTQNNLLDFADKFIELFASDLDILYFDAFPFFKLLKNVLSTPKKKDGELIASLRCPDDATFVVPSERELYKNWYNQRKLCTNIQKQEMFLNNTNKESYPKLRRVLAKLHLLTFSKKVYHVFVK